jgi:hypothetical protein
MSWAFGPLLPGAAQLQGGPQTFSGSGSPTWVTGAWANGAWADGAWDRGPALQILTSSGSGSVAASGVSGSGADSLPLLTASGAGVQGRKGSGTPSLPIITASGSGAKERKGTGTPSLTIITATGSGKKARAGTGTPSLPVLTASGSGKKASKGSGSPSLTLITSDGTGVKASVGSGTPSLPALTSNGLGGAVIQWVGSGDSTLPLLTAEGSSAPAKPEQTSGGWGAWNDYEAERRRRKRLRELELEDEADRLEALLIAEGKLPANPQIDDRITVREFAVQAEAFNRRTQRAIDYALRAQTALAYQLAAREIAKQVEEEELAMILMIAAA